MSFIIFDMDDTLIFSNRYFVENVQKTATAMSIYVPSEEKILAYCGWDEFIARTWPDVPVGEFKRVYSGFADTTVYQRIPGANEALEALAGEHLLYLVTSRPRARYPLRARQSELRVDLFEKVYCWEDVRYRKPDPRVVEPVLADCGLEPEQGFAVGDSLEDFEAFWQAGLSFAAVLTGYTTRDQFMEAGLPEEAILESIADFPGFVSR